MKTFLEYIYEEPVATQHSLGIDRAHMPQIKGSDIPDFLEFLREKGIRITDRSVPVKSLLPTQKEVDSDKIDSKIKTGFEIKPFIVSNDNRVLDGHHQLYALKQMNPEQSVKIYSVGLTMQKLLDIAKSYSKVLFKSL